MTEAQAGMLITIYAYVVMLMSLPLMIAASRYPLRKLLLATISLFAVSHVASAFATGFWTLLLSRIGVAFAHSIFWSVASPIAVRLVKGPFKALAMSMIVTGTAIAIIVGLPLGRIIGFGKGCAAQKSGSTENNQGDGYPGIVLFELAVGDAELARCKNQFILSEGF